MTIKVLSTVVTALFLTVISVVTIFAIIAIRHTWTRRRSRLLTAARAELATIAASGVVTSEIPEVLLRLNARERVSVFLAIAPAVGGESLVALRTMAERTSLMAWARERLDSRLWARRLVAARFLVAMGVDCQQLAAAMFTDQHPAVRSQAATWAASCGSSAPIDRLVDMLSDPDGQCRFTAKDALIRIGLPSVPSVNRVLDEGVPEQVTAALEVASALGDPSFAPHAERMARTGSTRQRALAAAVLAAAGSQDTGGILRALLDDPEAEVRRAAVRALAHQGDWSAAVAVAAHLRDPVWAVRREAGLALLRLGSPGLILLRQAAIGEDDAASIAAQALELRQLNMGT